MKSKRSPDRTSLARLAAAEDLRVGDDVSILSQVYEFPSFFWCDAPVASAPDEPVRIQMQTAATGMPLRILDVCLPFVLVRDPCGDLRTLDVRRCQLAKLKKRFARRARQAVRRNRHGGRKRRRK